MTDPLLTARSDHRCFGCGVQNPIGLHLQFESTADGVEAPFTPLPDHQGFENVVHGGIVSTLLDEAMSWAIAAAGMWAVTGEMRVRFRNALSVGEATTVSASLDDSRGRLISASARLTRASDGATIATATATFMRVAPETEAAWRERYIESRS
jgi:acyl-coenzyme A thioesterase PaaI-like protein